MSRTVLLAVATILVTAHVLSADILDTKFKSEKANAAVKLHKTNLEMLDRLYAAKQKEYRLTLVMLLEEAMKEAAKAVDLDEATKIREVIKSLHDKQDDADWRFKSKSATKAVRQYSAAVKSLDKKYIAKRKDYRTAFVAKLEVAMKEAAQAVDLDDATKIRAAIKSLESEPIVVRKPDKTKPKEGPQRPDQNARLARRVFLASHCSRSRMRRESNFPAISRQSLRGQLLRKPSLPIRNSAV